MDLIRENTTKTYWNGEPCSVKEVRVVVGKAPRPTWWCAHLEGTERNVLKVTQENYSFYIDNEDGSGWRKLTEGKGSPSYPHRSIPVLKEIIDNK